MPRKKRAENGPETVPDEAQPGPFVEGEPEGAEPGDSIGPDQDRGADPDRDQDQDSREGLEAALAEAESRTPDNHLLPDTKKRAKEERMSAEGELRQVRVFMRRLTPEKIMHNNQQLFCRGQKKVIDGQYTKDEIETLAEEHYGGGRVQVNVNDTDSGKMKAKYFFEFPGIPNVTNIISDCYGGDLRMAAQMMGGLGAVLPGAGTSAKPPEPATDEDRRLHELEGRRAELKKQREIKQAERELADEERQAQIDERERRKEQERDEQREMIEEEQRSGQYVLNHPFARRPGIMVRGGFQDHRAPYDPEDPERPMSQRELKESFEKERETDRLRGDIRRLEDMVRRSAEDPNKGTNMMEVMATMMAGMQQANAQIIAAITSANKKPEGENERWLTLFKLMADSNKSDKTVDMITRAAGLQEDRKSNEVANLVKMIELGTQLGRDGGADANGEWWESPLRGIGDILSAAAVRLGVGVGQPQPQVQLRPGPSAAVPVPGQITTPRLPVRQTAALPPPVAAAAARASAQIPQPGVTSMAGTPVIRLPAQQVGDAQAAIAQMEDATVTPEEEMSDTVNMILEEMLKQAESKPAVPDWVDAAYESLPFAMLKVIAASEDYNVLIEQFRPFADITLGTQLLARIEHDSLMTPWLVNGFRQLREMAQDQVEEYERQAAEASVARAAPATAPTAPTVPAPEAETEEVAEEGVEGAKTDARK